MKCILSASRFLILLLSPTIWAASAGTVISVETQTGGAVQIPVGSVARVGYTVTNNSPVTHTLTLKPVQGVQAIRMGVNACSIPFTLAQNQTCNLTLEVDPETFQGPQLRPMICNTMPTPFLCSQPQPSDVVMVSTIEPATKTAVGVNQETAENTPLLVQSRNGGGTWGTVDVSETPDGGQFFNTDCAGSGAGTYCLAVGGTPDDASAYTVPPFIVSTGSDGTIWRLVNISGAPALGNFYGTSCNKDAQFCNAVGDAIFYDNTGTTLTATPPLIAQSVDYGRTWAIKEITGGNVPANASFISSSCAYQSGRSTVCVASGQALVAPGNLKSTSNNPLLAQTKDSGVSWSVVNVNGAPEFGYFYHVSCSQDNDRAICVTVGQDYSTTSPLLAQTNTSGATWNTVSLPDMVRSGYLNDISCLGKRCVAVGANFEEQPDGSRIYQPLAFQTVNSGLSWSIVDIKGLSAVKNGMLYTVHSTGSDDNSVFVAGGANYDTEKPLLVQTLDGGANWSVINVSNEPLGWYNTVTCTGELSTATCTAVGQIGLSPSAPLIVQTRNGGADWAVVASSTISGLPNQGVFYWGASTGG